MAPTTRSANACRGWTAVAKLVTWPVRTANNRPTARVLFAGPEYDADDRLATARDVRGRTASRTSTTQRAELRANDGP